VHHLIPLKKLTAENTFNWFLLISALHGFVFSIVLFFSKYGKEKSIIYLNLLVLAISLNNFQSWVLAKQFFPTYFFLDYVHIPWHFLIAPFFYMFLVHYLEIAHQSRKLLRGLMSMFLLIISIRIVFVYLNKSNQNNATVYLFEKYTSIEEIISLLISLSVFGYSFYILKNKKNLFQKILSFDNLKWIYTFFKFGLFTYIFWMIALATTVYLNFSEFIFSYYPLRILTTGLIYWIGYQSIIQLQLVKEREKLREFISLEKNTTPEFKNLEVAFFNKKDTENYQQNFKKITTFITGKKLFLNPDFSLQQLSEELCIHSNKLSTIINSYHKEGFSNYINSLRITYAKRLLLDKKYAEYTITSIGLEAGFNSKSSFYSVFKKHTNFTPFQFQKTFSTKF